MARRLDDHLPAPTHKRAYPWDQWADGASWEILSGVDFTGKAEAFRNRLYDVAKRRGMRATVHVFRIPRSVAEQGLRDAYEAGRLDATGLNALVDHVRAGGRVHAMRGGQPVLEPEHLAVDLVDEYVAVDEDRPEGVEGLRFRFVDESAVDAAAPQTVAA